MLDFSTLSDDQLLQLLRELVAACEGRNLGVQEAARQIGIDAQERRQIADAAAEREFAAARARERQRVAEEAARIAREQVEAENEKLNAIRAQESGRAVAEAAAKRNVISQRLIDEADALLECNHSVLTIMILKDRDSGLPRLLINSGKGARYAKTHRIDYCNTKAYKVNNGYRGHTVKHAIRDPKILEWCQTLIMSQHVGLVIEDGIPSRLQEVPA